MRSLSLPRECVCLWLWILFLVFSLSLILRPESFLAHILNVVHVTGMDFEFLISGCYRHILCNY